MLTNQIVDAIVGPSRAFPPVGQEIAAYLQPFTGKIAKAMPQDFIPPEVQSRIDDSMNRLQESLAAIRVPATKKRKQQ